MGPKDQEPEDQRTRGPEDQRTRTRGPEDQRTRGPGDHGTRGPGDQRVSETKAEPNLGKKKPWPIRPRKTLKSARQTPFSPRQAQPRSFKTWQEGWGQALHPRSQGDFIIPSLCSMIIEAPTPLNRSNFPRLLLQCEESLPKRKLLMLWLVCWPSKSSFKL